MLSNNDKQILLLTARIAIKDSIEGTDSELGDIYPDSLKDKCGAFVTLHSNSELRGCIGYIEGIMSLVETVREVAIKAALEDPRFVPVTSDELDDIEIEISVLSPLKKITDIKLIEVGKHGLVIERNNFRGLLLPQVATEYNWDKETFLNQTCRKAGLPPDSWKDNKTTIKIFDAEIFHE
ncbi:MAG: AmmeMemoRadiSam system protein A [Ignavibacteriales bacterium]|nr:AmmeMemoRadiSam system protein A [Ignavibacteriales bacterium]